MSVNETPNQFLFSGFRLDASRRKLFSPDNKAVSLSSRAFEVLLVLVNHRGETLSKNTLMESVWPDVVVEDNNLSQAISSLRKALNDPRSESRIIQTVPGRGYCFVAPVETLEETEASVSAQTLTDEPSSPSSSPAFPRSAEPATIQSASRTGRHPFLNRLNAAALLIFTLAVIAASVHYLGNSAEDIADSGSSTTDSFDQESSNGADSGDTGYIKNSIAVLPFTNLNPDAENTVFTVGLHDEVINRLSKVSSLQVMSRSSVLTITSQYQALDEISRLLQVESVMTGTILFIDDKARVNLQLLDPETGVTLWSSTYEANTQNLSEMLSIQSDIALNVANALEAEINQLEQDEIGALPTTSFEAYRFNLAGRNAYYQQNYESALLLSKQAIELDPDYYDALTLYSSVNAVLMGTPLPGMTTDMHYQLALDSAERMIEIAPEKPEGYILKTIPLANAREWKIVAEELDHLQHMGIKLSRLNMAAPILMSLGDFDKAIEILEANLQADPVNLFGRGFLLAAYEANGQRAQSREEYVLGEKLSPLWWGDTINIFLALGRDEPVTGIDDIFGISEELRYSLRNINNREQINADLQRFITREDKIPAETLYYAAIAAHAGQHEVALSLMRQTLGDVWYNFYFLWLPVFDGTRQLEGFKDLLTESRIVEYWQQYGWPKMCTPDDDSFTCDWKAYP